MRTEVGAPVSRVKGLARDGAGRSEAAEKKEALPVGEEEHPALDADVCVPRRTRGPGLKRAPERAPLLTPESPNRTLVLGLVEDPRPASAECRGRAGGDQRGKVILSHPAEQIIENRPRHASGSAGGQFVAGGRPPARGPPVGGHGGARATGNGRRNRGLSEKFVPARRRATTTERALVLVMGSLWGLEYWFVPLREGAHACRRNAMFLCGLADQARWGGRVAWGRTERGEAGRPPPRAGPGRVGALRPFLRSFLSV